MGEILSRSQFNKAVGQTLRDLRMEFGLSQEQFAGTAGLGRTHYGSIERGEKSIHAYNLYRLLEANGLSISDFFDKI